MVTAIDPLGTGGWGSALGALTGFGGQGFLVLPPLPVPLPVPGGPLLLPRRRAVAAALQPALAPRFREVLLDHVPHGDVDRGARRVLLGFSSSSIPSGRSPSPGLSGRVQVLQCLCWKRKANPSARSQSSTACRRSGAMSVRSSKHAAFALGVAVAVVLVPNQPTQ